MDPRIWQAVSPSGGLHVARPALTLGAYLSTRRRYHNFRMWRSGQRFHEIREEYGPSPSHHKLGTDTACLLLLAKEIHEAGQLEWRAKDDENIDCPCHFCEAPPISERPHSSARTNARQRLARKGDK